MNEKIYEARDGSPFSADDAQEIGEFFEKHQGKSTEELLAAVKKNTNSAAYKYIEWDDGKAGQEFRLHQIRNIVNHITLKITEVGSRVPLRAFFSVRASPQATENTYCSFEATFEDEYLKKQIIRRAWNELQNWADRYRQYNELAQAISIIEPIIIKAKEGKIMVAR